MSRRPSRRALPPDRFGEAAADDELQQALTSSSSDDDDDGGGGGTQQHQGRRRVTTTTVDESDDDDDNDDHSENLRGADSATSSERPQSDSECDGAWLKEGSMGEEAAAEEREAGEMVPSFFPLFFPPSSHSPRPPPLTSFDRKKLPKNRGNLGPERALLPPAGPQGHHAQAQRTQGKEKEEKWREEKKTEEERREREAKATKVKKIISNNNKKNL